MNPEDIVERIKNKFPGDFLSSGTFAGQSWAVVKRDRLEDICRFLKEEPELKLDFLIDVTAVDWLPSIPRFEVVYNMHSMSHGHRIRLKVPVDEADAWVPSVVGVWKTAGWHERETYDMFGVHFHGNPDHRRILMSEEWEGHPLRKDYPVLGPEYKFTPWQETE